MADYNYINLDLVAAANDSFVAPAAIYQEQRLSPLVPRARDFKLALSRLTVCGLDLPLFVPLIKTGQSDPRLTVYSVALQTVVAGQAFVSATQAVMWSPQFEGEPLPPSPLEAGQQLNSKYYWCKHYSHFLNLVNSAVGAALADLNTQLAAAGLPSVSATAPRFAFVASTGKFELVVADASVNVCLNGPLWNLLCHWPFKALASGDCRYIIDNDGFTDAAGLHVEQMRPSTDFWSPIQSLVVSTAMPIEPEASGMPNKLGESDAFLSSNNNSQVTLTDVALELVGGSSDWLGTVVFAPQLYRWIQMNGSEALSSLSFSLFWKNRFDSQLYQVGLLPSASASLKILLQHVDASG